MSAFVYCSFFSKSLKERVFLNLNVRHFDELNNHSTGPSCSKLGQDNPGLVRDLN